MTTLVDIGFLSFEQEIGVVIGGGNAVGQPVGPIVGCENHQRADIQHRNDREVSAAMLSAEAFCLYRPEGVIGDKIIYI